MLRSVADAHGAELHGFFGNVFIMKYSGLVLNGIYVNDNILSSRSSHCKYTIDLCDPESIQLLHKMIKTCIQHRTIGKCNNCEFYAPHTD